MSHTRKETSTLHPLFGQDVRAVVFDLDGTLIDSGADILQGMRMTFEQAGIGLVPEDYFPDNMHGTAEGILRAIAADMGWPIPEQLAPLRALYLANAATLDFQRTQLYDGALDVLLACRAASLPMAICTNKMHAGAIAALRKFGIEDLFTFVTGSDTWAEAKPSPVPLLKTLDMLGFGTHECIYLGDTSTDAECARAAGVRFVLYESGYGDENLTGKPRHFAFHDWNELLVAQAATA